MSYLTQNVFELPHPEITGITTVDSETPFGDFSEYLIEISNIPLYDPEKPRYSIVYSYRKPSNNLNLDMQIPVNDCFAFLPLNKNGKFIKRRMTQFYVLLPYEERNFYLTIIDTMLEKVIFQCCVTNEMVDECKDDESLDFLWGYEHFQDDLVSVWQTQYLRVEACNRLKPDGVYRDYFSVSFPCNNSCHKEDFAVVLTRNEDDSEFDAIIVDGTNDIKENEEVRILSKFVKHRRGYVVFSVPIIERVKNPYFVNIVDGLTGRFYARMNTSRYDWLFKERAEVEDFEEPTIFNDSAIYQRWYKQHEALPVDLAKQRTLVFKRPTKFSVVITVDNENVIFLEDTLQSITVQTYGNYEVIVASSVPKSSDYWSCPISWCQTSFSYKL